jgi:hypothetical protein
MYQQWCVVDRRKKKRVTQRTEYFVCGLCILDRMGMSIRAAAAN